jgi:uncharacterized membrane protein
LIWATLAASLASAQVLTVDDVSPHYCAQLGGASAGNRTCNAPYQPYGGDACSIYRSLPDKYPPTSDWFSSTTSSCNAAAVTEAKKRTLSARAALRGYVSLGNDESVNDPVSNPSFRPGGATAGAGESYFAAECAVRTCGGGSSAGPGGQQPPSPATSPPPSPPPQTRPPEPQEDTFIFEICNRSSQIAFATVAHYKRSIGGYTVRGWWRIEVGQCREIGPLPKPWLYYRVQANNPPKAWLGPGRLVRFCVAHEPFEHPASTKCDASLVREFSEERVQGRRVSITLP